MSNAIVADADGRWRRPASSFRDTVEQGGRFPPEKDRYHLYVSYGCPWAHRTLIVRALKGLEDIIPISVVSPRLVDRKWRFKKIDPFPGTTDDPNLGASYLVELYNKADPSFEGRWTVPVLWDKKLNTIVNNESSEIIRIFNSAFNEFLPEEKKNLHLYPKELQKEIDELNAWVYDTINNGVYKAGFSGTQEAYEEAVTTLFKSLDRIESILADGKKEFLIGGRLTEADVRLYVTIVRFDVAYHGNFKCNIRSIRHDYPNINRWLKNIYWNNEAFIGTTRFDHIKGGYYSLGELNPKGIVPVGPLPPVEPL